MRIINLVLFLLIILATVGATYQKYSKNVYAFQVFDNRVQMLEFLNSHTNLTFVQIYRNSENSKWELYYATRVYLEKCIYGCEDK